MKVYTFGDKEKPTIMLFPGTCCYWKNNFGHVIKPLEEHFYTLVVSYSGFDETEKTTFISELDQFCLVCHQDHPPLNSRMASSRAVFVSSSSRPVSWMV